MRSEEETYKIYGCFVMLFFIFPALIYFMYNVMQDRLERDEIITEAWKQKFVQKGINSIYFVIDTIFYDTGYHGFAWTELKRLYINGKIANPDTLYSKEDFIYKNCGQYYYFGTYDTDSISFEFPPKDQYLDFYHKKRAFRGTGPGSAYLLMDEYKDKLPKCLNITK